VKRPAFVPLLLSAISPAAAQPMTGASEACAARLLEKTGQIPTLELIDQASRICGHMAAIGFNNRTLEANAMIYEGQLKQNTVMLWMVVAITVSGVILAAVQLWATYRLAAQGKQSIGIDSTVTIEAKRLAVQSSVVGVIILALSLVFFTVYVMYVFRIDVATGGEAPRSTADAEQIPG
jgi:hypothetical protein